MHVDLGSQAVRPFIGGSLAVRVAKNATLLAVDDGIARQIALRDIKAGDPVAVVGWVDRSSPGMPIFVARTIRVVDRTPADELTVFACGGPVNAGTRALWRRLAGSLDVVVMPTTQILFNDGTTSSPITLGEVTMGEKAWVSGTIDRSQATPVFTAVRITVRAATAPAPTAGS